MIRVCFAWLLKNQTRDCFLDLVMKIPDLKTFKKETQGLCYALEKYPLTPYIILAMSQFEFAHNFVLYSLQF